MHRSLIDYLNHIDNEIDSLTLSCEDNVINIDPLKKIKEKIMRRCDEIGQANSKYELNAIKFKIDYEVGDLIIEFEKILVRTKEEKRKKIFEKLKNLQNVIRSKNLDWRFNEKLLSFKSVPEIIYDENNKLKEELSDENLEINKKKIENIISIDYDINEIKNHVNMIMKHTLKYFEYYAAHGFNHVERVLDIMGRFIPDIFKTKFNPFELYILVVSSYTHDIGLAIDPAEWNGINKKHYGKKLPIESKNWDDILEKEKDIIRKLMRRYHAEIGAGYVLENWGDLKIKDFHTANYISKIIEAHSSKFNINELDKWNSIDFEKKTERFRTKFLASILRIVDALDIAFGRAKLEEFDWKRIKLKAPDQVVHWAYKMLIGSVTFKREGIGNWEIQINHLAKNGDELRNLMMFEGCSLKRELNSVKDILENEGVDSENKEKSIYLLYEKISFVDERTGETIELTDDKFDELLKERNTDEGKMKLNECANEIADRILKK